MTSKEIAKHRLISQQLAGTKLKSAVEMVHRLCAVQAQEYAQTKWGLGLRLPHLTDDDIENDFTAGKIIRTHVLRPTWHFVSANDIKWLLTLTAPRVNAVNAYMYRQLELDASVFNRCNDILVRALQGNKQLSRDTLNEAFRKNKIIAKGHRLSYIMMYAELAGIVCSGARQGNQFTYALLNERVRTTRSLDNDEALSELATRYFMSRGPATLKDFSTWSGLTLTDCRKALEVTKLNFAKEVVEGDEYYFSSKISLNNKRLEGIYLLPIYDEFIMGYKNRSAVLEFKRSIKSRSLFHYDCMIVSDGQIIGTWKRTIAKNSIEIEFEFFRPASKDQRKAFDNAIHHFEKFTNTAVTYDKKRTTTR